MISQPPYVWYHIQYTCDILCTIFMVSYPLCKTRQHSVLLIPHSAYVWHHLHYRWYHFHSITPNHCLWCHIYYNHDITPTVLDIAPTVSLSSQPLHWYHSRFFCCSELCHTLEWNSHGFTCVPHSYPLSHLPLHHFPLGFPSAPGPRTSHMLPTWAGDLFHPRYYTCFDAVLLKHPTISFSDRV